jgi:hypothetical protein
MGPLVFHRVLGHYGSADLGLDRRICSPISRSLCRYVRTFLVGSIQSDLPVGQAMAAVVVGQCLVALAVVATGLVGAHWHVGFPMWNRVSHLNDTDPYTVPVQDMLMCLR